MSLRIAPMHSLLLNVKSQFEDMPCFSVPKIDIHTTMSRGYGLNQYERSARKHSIGLRTVIAFPDETSFPTMHAEAQPMSQTPRSPSKPSSHMHRLSNSIL